jgi:hypothetical protein
MTRGLSRGLPTVFYRLENDELTVLTSRALQEFGEKLDA